MITVFFNPSIDEMEDDSTIYLLIFIAIGCGALLGWFLQVFSFTYMG